MAKPKTPWARCAGVLRSGANCDRAVARGEDGKPGDYCANHASTAEATPPLVAVVGESTVDEEPDVEAEPVVGPPDILPEPVAIGSIRAALRGDLSTSSVADSIAELLLEGLRASKDLYMTCSHCSKRSPVSLPDLGTRIAAARALMEELEGKLAAQAKSSEDRVADALAGKTRIQDLTDDELTILIANQKGRDPDEDWLKEDVYQAAKRVLSEHPFKVAS